MGGQAGGHTFGVKLEARVKMQIDPLSSVVLQTGNSMAMDYLAHGVVGIFAAVLFSLSLYAWSRRRHVGLQLVSLAFLVFCLKEVFWVLSQMYGLNSSETGELVTDLVTVLTDLLVLGFFFIAIIVRPRKQPD